MLKMHAHSYHCQASRSLVNVYLLNVLSFSLVLHCCQAYQREEGAFHLSWLWHDFCDAISMALGWSSSNQKIELHP